MPGLQIALAALLLTASAGASAALKVSAERISRDGLEARAVVLGLEWPAGAERGALTLDVGSLRLATPAFVLERLRWRCALQRSDIGWRCDGSAEAKGLRRGTLRIEGGSTALQARLARGAATLEVALDPGQPNRVTLQVRSLPLDWLQPILSEAWPEATLTAGSLSATLELDVDAAGLALSGPVSIAELGLDTRDGSIAAAGVAASGSLKLDLRDSTAVALAIKLAGGELLAGPAYVELPPTAVALAVEATREAQGGWRIARLHWRDGSVLDIEANASLAAAGPQWFDRYALELSSADLGLAVDRYARSLLARAGLPAATASGRLGLTLQAEGSARPAAELKLAGADFDDGSGRLMLAGLDGSLLLSRDASERDGELGWRRGALYGMALGPAQLKLASADGGVWLREPLAVDVLQGRIEVDSFRWLPANAGNDEGRLDLALTLARLDLGGLSQRFGWPPFTGSLSGRLPAARYEQGRLSLDGGLEVSVFDGRVRVEGLQLERPFGVAPTLSGDIALSGLDLGPLTSAFGFGEITGRLDGRIGGLRLVDWSPVAFDAQLATVARPGVSQRISQRAVNDLSRVGGAGMSGGLQGTAMRLFDTFGYSRIGLGCRLANNVCEMRGLASAGGSSAAGYTIVEGAGLPRITVNGFQRRVDWPVLVARLKAVTEGQSPRIE